MTATKTLPEITRSVGISPAIDEKARTAVVSFSSETPVRDYSYGPPVVLLHERQAVDFSALADIGAVLLNHDVGRIVGRPENPRLDANRRRGVATIRFDDDAESETVFRKVVSGSLRGVSVRFLPTKAIDVADGKTWTSPGGKRFTGPLTVAVRWQPREISLTPLPADAAVGVGRILGMEEENMPQWLKDLLASRGIALADDATEDDARRALEGILPEAGDAGDDSTRAAEAERVRDLSHVAQLAGMEADLPRWLSNGTTVEAARGEALKKRAASNVNTPIVSFNEWGAEERDKFRDAHTVGLVERMGLLRDGDPTAKGITPERCSLLDLAKRCLKRAGLATYGTDTEIIARAVAGTSSDFPYLLENSLNKAVGVVYAEAGSSYDRWCAVRASNSLERAESRLVLSEAPDLELNPEAMPIEEGAFIDAKQSVTTYTYARRFSITRKAIVNDEVGFLESVGRALGLAGRRIPNDLVYSTLLAANSGAGPAMRDTNNLFDSSNHGNVGTAGALAIGTLGELRKLLRLQTGPNAAYLNLSPRVLLVPAALETTAEQLISTLLNPATAATVNVPWIRGLEVVSEARLDDISSTGYYVACGPATPAVEVNFLNGKRTPSIIRENHTNVLGVSWTAVLDCGAAVLDWRAIARNAGA